MSSEKKRILIVEDDKQFVDRLIIPTIKEMGIDYESLRHENNATDAIRALENSAWDLVILDLGIYESKEGISIGAKQRYGMSVWKRVQELNSRLPKEIRVVVLSGNFDDEETRSLIEGHGWSAGIGKSDVVNELPGAVKRAFEIKDTPKQVVYDGFSSELLNSLKVKNGKIYDYLLNKVKRNFDKGHSLEAIKHAYELLVGTLGVLACDSGFDVRVFLGDDESKKRNLPEGQLDQWLLELVSKKILGHLEEKYSRLIREIRNKYAHGSEATLDDAVIVMALLIPILKKFVNKD